MGQRKQESPRAVGRVESGQTRGSVDRMGGLVAVLQRFEQPAPFRGWSVLGRAEAERRLDFPFSNFSASFLRC